ncbi:DUF3347 domain-containing protein [Chitinophaga vietnamensis]|uniref:DUF3347 domain-containing protein n=1 Tax=Chitinophaga vietnamensis TaxID=2593957 RepID=UPI001177B700|nr:DUF3347 domain-containing protein [Chitinophaga vietnamensis]
MKKIFLAAAFIFGAFAQNSIAQDRTSKLAPALTLYMDVKDALVGSNANNAATKAADFAKTAAAIDAGTLSPEEQKAFAPLQQQLIADAKSIAAAKDIAQQREYFKTFSDHFYTLAKGVKLSAAPVYQEYCPMKKAYWLSNSATIKNPYFGNQMLSCGKVSDTIK